MILTVDLAHADSCKPVSTGELCADAPAGEAGDQCRVLASYVIDFQQTVCTQEVEGLAPHPEYAAILTRANANIGSSLLVPGNLDYVDIELNRLSELGVSVIALNIGYPLLTPSFHEYLAQADSSYQFTSEDYIAFYREVVERIRARKLKVQVQHGYMLAQVAATNPVAYFNSIKASDAALAHERFVRERAEEARLILTELSPDYLTLVAEPQTAKDLVGQSLTPLMFTPEASKVYLEQAIQRFPAHSTKLGAGAGTWESEEYIRLFASMPELDYIDLHVYPAKSVFGNYLDRIISWTDLVHSYDPEKAVTIGESWLHKIDENEVLQANARYIEFLSRGVFSYWEPLDSQFLELLSYVSRVKGIQVLTPFWSRHYFAYLDYEQASSMNPIERMLAVDKKAFDNMREGRLTATGKRYQSLALEAKTLVVNDVSPDHGPQTGPGLHQVVTISGANFQPGSDTIILFGDKAATGVQVIDATRISAVVPAGSGAVDVVVQSPDGRIRALPAAYVYDLPPVIKSITPNRGVEAGGTIVTIQGENFVAGSSNTVVLFGEHPATAVTVYANHIVARAPAGVALGTVGITVQNPDLQSTVLPASYTFVPPPTVLSVSPDRGAAIGGSSVAITGSGFAPGATVWFGGVQSPNVTVTSATQIIAEIPVAAGTVKVTVFNPDGQKGELDQAFRYLAPPTVMNIVGSSGPETGGNDVWLVGYGFQPGVQVFFGASSASIQTVTENVIQVKAPPGSGQVTILVRNPDGQEGVWPNPYRYTSKPAPVILLITPTQITSSGGATVYIYGQNFVPQSTNTVVKFGSRTAPKVTVLSANWIQVTAPAGEGQVAVTVINPDGQQGTSLGTVSFVPPGVTPGETDPMQDDPLQIGDKLPEIPVFPEQPEEKPGEDPTPEITGPEDGRPEHPERMMYRSFLPAVQS